MQRRKLRAVFGAALFCLAVWAPRAAAWQAPFMPAGPEAQGAQTGFSRECQAAYDGFVWVYPPETGIGGGDTPQAPDPEARDIDIMILYTAETQAAVGDIQAEARAQVAELNAILENSQTGTSFNLVHLEQVDHAAGAGLATTLDRLYNASDGYMDHVHDWRNAYGADLVSLWDLGADDGTAGIAHVLTGWSFDTGDLGMMRDQAFSVINYSYADYVHTAHTFAHELGHNLGLEHDPWTKQYLDGGQEIGPFAYNHGYVDFGAEFLTVMAYDTPLYQQGSRSEDITYLPYYSNPGISYEGRPIGDEAASNAAAVIRQTAAWVAAYR